MLLICGHYNGVNIVSSNLKLSKYVTILNNLLQWKMAMASEKQAPWVETSYLKETMVCVTRQCKMAPKQTPSEDCIVSYGGIHKMW